MGDGKKKTFKQEKKNRDLGIFKVHPNFPGEGGWRVRQPRLCKLHLKKKRRSIHLTGPEMLDTILPSLQDVGRHLLPTLPSLSQEGRRQGLGAGDEPLPAWGKAKGFSPSPVSGGP